MMACGAYWRIVAAVLCSIGLLGLTGCAGTSPSADHGLTIGVIDPQRVLEETHAGKSVSESLQQFMTDRQALIELEQQELRRMESELLAQGSVLSQSARQQREEQFRRRMGEYQRKVADLNREVQEKQKELMDAFRERIQGAVTQIAEDRELAIVVEHGAGTSTFYHQSQLDLSDEVIRRMNEDDS